ncbi:MAG: dipeptide epimerase [Bryobacteraceae bacterium]|nr:dipeptide epimerase [Bryobacteraceae bacterium]
MHRRSFLLSSAAAPLALAVPASSAHSKVEFDIKRLKLRHTWTTVMSSSDYRDTFFVKLVHDGITAIGEGAPIVRYKESAETAKAALTLILPLLETANPWYYRTLLNEVSRRVEGEYAAKAALDIALLDWAGKRLGIPVHKLLGIDPAGAPLTTFSIGIDDPEATRKKVEEAAAFPVLKIKVGLGKDEATIEAVRAVTNKPLRTDANEGYKTKEEAVERINFLEKHGVEFIEQPLVASNLEDMNWIRKRVHMPIFADEACLHLNDVPKVAQCFDGINVKVDKAGGLLAAMREIELARSLGLKVMIGCMVSSSVAVTAAAQLSPLVDYADLDGNLLISNDAYEGVLVEKGKLVLPNRPGLGLKARA